MKQNNIILQFVFIVLLQGLLIVNSENIEENRKWLELDKTLYRIEPRAKYTWNQAATECKKELSSLINPQGAYDYSKLYYFIKQNFKNYSSFWTNNKVKVPSVLAQIGFNRNSEVKCNRFENITFKYGQDECEKKLGFICEKPIMEGVSQFQISNKKFYIQPKKQFTCGQSLVECNKSNMSLVLYDDYFNNTDLENYVDLNYGSSPRFWLAYDDKYRQCKTIDEGIPVNTRTQFGFICERRISKAFLSLRHLVLIIFVTVAAIIAIIVFIIMRCCIRNKIKSYTLEIPEPVKQKSDTSI